MPNTVTQQDVNGGVPPLFPAPWPGPLPNGGAEVVAQDTTGMSAQGIAALIEQLRMAGLAGATTYGVDLSGMDAAGLASLYTAAVADANAVVQAALASAASGIAPAGGQPA